MARARSSRVHAHASPEPLALPELPPLLSADEVAGLLRTTRKAIYGMIERRQIPGVVRIGERRILVRRDVLLAWLHERELPGPSSVSG